MSQSVQNPLKLFTCSPMRIIPNGAGGTRVESLTVEWHRAIAGMHMPFGWNGAEIRLDGYEVGEARCLAVQSARQQGGDFLLFIDNDVLVPPFAFRQLLYRATATHPDVDIFAGVYCDKSQPPFPIIFKEWNSGPYWDWTIGDVIEDVKAVPMGCTLLRLSLFDRLKQTEEKPWFKTVRHEDMPTSLGTMTEDIYFCKRAVEEAGCKILVDTKVICGHISNSSGELFVLPEDCPPVKRAGIKLSEPEAAI